MYYVLTPGQFNVISDFYAFKMIFWNVKIKENCSLVDFPGAEGGILFGSVVVEGCNANIVSIAAFLIRTKIVKFEALLEKEFIIYFLFIKLPSIKFLAM